MVAGAVAAVLFFWFIKEAHPESHADVSLQEEAAREISISKFRELGYAHSYTPHIQFKANRALLDSLQLRTDLGEYFSNPQIRRLNPGYYWQAQIKTGERFVDESTSPIFDNVTKSIDMRLSEDGRLMAFENEENIVPEYKIAPVLQAMLDNEPDVIMPDEISDIQFQIFNTQNRREEGLTIFGENIILGASHAEEFARDYLKQSLWPEEFFKTESIEAGTRGSIRIARVNFVSESEFVEFPVELSVVVLPSGQLFELTYAFDLGPESDQTLEITFQFLRVVTFIIAGIWVLSLLFSRFQRRLIDMRVAVLGAVLGGIVVPFIFFLQITYQMNLDFQDFGWLEIIAVFVPVGLIAALTSVVFFIVTAIADSVTRKAWREKLMTVDFFRVGMVSNIGFGLNLVKGIAYGFIIAALWVITILYLPNAFISGSEDVFHYYVSYLSFLSEILGHFFLALIIAQLVFLIFAGLLKEATRSKLLMIVVPALILVLIGPFPIETGPTLNSLIISAITGILMGWIYYREDFLTVFISLFVFGMAVSTSTGWVTENSPDAFSFYLFLILTVLGLVLGAVMIFRGADTKELPDFVPEYIKEIAQDDRIKQELQIARKVQQSFLPVRTPQVEGFDIAAICKPAHETGGDYYDFIRLEDDSVAVTIGDVSGKGIQAAFYMTFAKGILHSLCNDFTSTIDVLSKTNKLFRKNADRRTFVSLIFGVLNSRKGTFSFSRAGHNPLLYFDYETKTLHEHKPEGLAIGMTDDETFLKHISEEKIHLKQNDLIILFTDGVVESVSKTNKVYGDRRLFNLIKKHHHLPAKKIIQKIEDDLQKFEEKSEQHDDMTMVVIKKK